MTVASYRFRSREALHHALGIDAIRWERPSFCHEPFDKLLTYFYRVGDFGTYAVRPRISLPTVRIR